MPAFLATAAIVTAWGPCWNSNSRAAARMAWSLCRSRGRPGWGAGCAWASVVIFVRSRSLIVWSRFFMRSRLPSLLCSLLLLGACSEQSAQNAPVPVPLVKTVVLAGEIQSPRQGFSGTVRARSEIPIAFEVPGRISQRHVDAGQTVTLGQRLFTLDSRDLEQNRESAQAALNAAEAEREVARADLVRHRHLIGQNTISQQAFERVQLTERAAESRVQVAQAQLQQARIALDHTELRAKSAGVLMDVGGEPGQVVNPGQPLATLADASQIGRASCRERG